MITRNSFWFSTATWDGEISTAEISIATCDLVWFLMHLAKIFLVHLSDLVFWIRSSLVLAGCSLFRLVRDIILIRYGITVTTSIASHCWRMMFARHLLGYWYYFNQEFQQPLAAGSTIIAKSIYPSEREKKERKDSSFPAQTKLLRRWIQFGCPQNPALIQKFLFFGMHSFK